MKNIKKIIFSTLAFYVAALTMMMPLTFAANLGERTLKYGFAGEDVKELQVVLNHLGYDSGIMDGNFGSQTRDALTSFQGDKNLTADGIAGIETLKLLISNQQTKTSRGSNIPERYKKVVDIVATAYAPGPHDNGKWGTLTHLGTQVRPGIIAVDPQVIPLGSRVYIEYPDGHGVYAVAEDTGGAIKGNRIDIALWTVDEAYNFGIQNVKVYVL